MIEEYTRHIGHAHVHVVAQGEYLALPGGQPAERLDELAALLETDGGVGVLMTGPGDPGRVPAGD
jgi:hypothetical protein